MHTSHICRLLPMPREWQILNSIKVKTINNLILASFAELTSADVVNWTDRLAKMDGQQLVLSHVPV